MRSLYPTLVFAPLASAAVSQPYVWKNVKIGGGGGYVPNIVFNPTQQGLVYARTDIGCTYRMNPDASWTPLLDWVDNAHWDYWGCDALATDPVDPARLYLVSIIQAVHRILTHDMYGRPLGCTPIRMTQTTG